MLGFDLLSEGVFCVIGCQVAPYWGRAALSQKISYVWFNWFDISKLLIRIAAMVHFNVVISKTSFTKGYRNRFNNYQSPGDLNPIYKLLSPFPSVFLWWKRFILCHGSSLDSPALLEFEFIFLFLCYTRGTPSKSLVHVSFPFFKKIPVSPTTSSVFTLLFQHV